MARVKEVYHGDGSLVKRAEMEDKRKGYGTVNRAKVEWSDTAPDEEWHCCQVIQRRLEKENRTGSWGKRRED